MTPETALIAVITDLLVADPAVFALVAGRVFDEVPNDRKPGTGTPYIYIGPINRQRVPFDCATVWQIRCRLYAVTTAFGRGLGWRLVESIATALDGKDAPDIALPRPFSLQSRFDVTQAGDVVDPLAPKALFLDLTTTIAKDAAP